MTVEEQARTLVQRVWEVLELQGDALRDVPIDLSKRLLDEVKEMKLDAMRNARKQELN